MDILYFVGEKISFTSFYWVIITISILEDSKLAETTDYVNYEANTNCILGHYGPGQSPFLSSFLCFTRNGGFGHRNEFPSDQDA